MQQQQILITGGTGFLGVHLQKIFYEMGFPVSLLTRNVVDKPGFFQWNVEKRTIDPAAFENTGTIIHLAGAGIADKRWKDQRKQLIMDSRVKGAELIYERLKANPQSVKTFISASAIGIYGNTGSDWVDETFPAAKDFLGETCRRWEEAANRFSALGIRVVIIRIGIVLAKDGGALPRLALPVKLFAGSYLGSGRQFMSWIHIDDLCAIFLRSVMDQNMNGIYNAVSPEPVTNKEFTRGIAGVLHRPVFPFHVPGGMLKMLLGEKAGLVLDSQRVSAKKLVEQGFRFRFAKLKDALSVIYH